MIPAGVPEIDNLFAVPNSPPPAFCKPPEVSFWASACDKSSPKVNSKKPSKNNPKNPYEAAFGRAWRRMGPLFEYIYRQELNQAAPGRGCFAGAEKIAEYYNMSVRTVFNYKTKLVKSGVAYRKRIPRAGRKVDMFTTDKGKKLYDMMQAWRELQESNQRHNGSQGMQTCTDPTAKLQSHINKNNQTKINSTGRRRQFPAKPRKEGRPAQAEAEKMKPQKSIITRGLSWEREWNSNKPELESKAKGVFFRTFLEPLVPLLSDGKRALGHNDEKLLAHIRQTRYGKYIQEVFGEVILLHTGSQPNIQGHFQAS